MFEPRVDASVPGPDDDTADLAEAAEAAGSDGIWAPEPELAPSEPLCEDVAETL